MTANSYLEVNTSALRSNAESILASLAPGAKLVPVLKGNAYGLGAVPAARLLAELPEIDTFAVSHVSEGLALRRAGIREEIWVMSLPPDGLYEAAAERDLTLTLASFRQLELLRSLSKRLGRPVKVQLKLDTGLHRIGFPESELPELAAALPAYASCLRICGTFSHFADDVPEHMDRQFACFLRGLACLENAGIPTGIRSISSSAPMERSHRYDLDAVRIGRRLYMDHPSAPVGGIAEVPSLRTYLTDVRERRAGETLAYGSSFVLPKDTRVGLISVGYGDGIPEALFLSGAPILIRGQKARLLAACMDQSFADLGEISCEPGDEVTFFGRDGKGSFLSSQEVAARIGDKEGCGLTAALLPRVERIYI